MSAFEDFLPLAPRGASGGMRVPRHPHTGFATVPRLFDGAIVRRDAPGSHASVRPGDEDLMVAGVGITPSECSSPDTTVLHGVQLRCAPPHALRVREREFLVATRGDAEQLGRLAPHTPAALPAPALPHGRLRTRGRVGHPEEHPA